VFFEDWVYGSGGYKYQDIIEDKQEEAAAIGYSRKLLLQYMRQETKEVHQKKDVLAVHDTQQCRFLRNAR
jgi:hypothetical protein